MAQEEVADLTSKVHFWVDERDIEIERREITEQEAATLRASLADLRETETVLRGEIRRSESAIAKVDEITQERDTLRAQVAAVEALHRSDGSGGTGPFCVECARVDAHPDQRWPCATIAALGDSAPVVQRIKATALEEAADALKPRPGKPCEQPENCCGTASSCDAVTPRATIVGEGWLRERASRVREGEPS